MAPDFEYCFWIERGPVLGHSLLGQLTFCLPITLAVTFAITRWVAAPVAGRLPDLGPLHLRDLGRLQLSARGLVGWSKVVTCALVGSLSHLLLDGFTHAHGFAATWFPVLLVKVDVLGQRMAYYRVLQYLVTLAGGPLCLAFLWSIGRRRALLAWLPGELSPPISERRALGFLWLPMTLGIALGVWRQLPLFRDPSLYMEPDPVYLTAYAAYLTACHAFFGLTVGAAALALFEARR
jgi:hypothetical protein